VSEAARHRVRLLVSREEARKMLQRQLDEGSELLSRRVENHADLQEAEGLLTIWRDYTQELLRKLFDRDEIAAQFISSLAAVIYYAGPRTAFEQWEDDRTSNSPGLTSLKSIVARLDLFEEAVGLGDKVSAEEYGEQIFIVHGHDGGVKHEVARLVERLDLQPIILHEQPNRGQTIIEKLEDYSEKLEVGYAVIILTPDDVGGVAEETPRLKPRARQNVVFELGYFMGKLGRGRVCALHSEGVELPSDYDGVLYIKLDKFGAWKLELAKEIKAVGFDVDLNKIP